jgi:hypothetical protein
MDMLVQHVQGDYYREKKRVDAAIAIALRIITNYRNLSTAAYTFEDLLTTSFP